MWSWEHVGQFALAVLTAALANPWFDSNFKKMICLAKVARVAVCHCDLTRTIEKCVRPMQSCISRAPAAGSPQMPSSREIRRIALAQNPFNPSPKTTNMTSPYLPLEGYPTNMEIHTREPQMFEVCVVLNDFIRLVQ